MSGLRVIAGKARGRKLKSVPGDTTRPITDRAKESLFNILQDDVNGATFLDMFAGTGSVGIEALSRGATFVRFIDLSRAAIQTIKANLQHTQLTAGAQIVRGDAFKLLAQAPDRQFDFIFIAPPQYQDLWQRALMLVDECPAWLQPDGWVIVQIDPLEYGEKSLQNLEEFDRRKYGSTLLVFFALQQNQG